MIIEVNSVEINETEVVLEGTNLETIFTADDLFQEIEEEPVRFVFDRQENHGAGMKYLWKVVSSNAKCKNEKSFGEMIEKLASGGCIISLSENFLVR